MSQDETVASSAPLLIQQQDGLCQLTLNRPQRANALDASLTEALLQALQQCAGNGTRLLVLRGAGRNFCGGFDLSDADSAGEGELLRRFVRIEQVLQALWHAPYAVLALAHGRNAGAGTDLFLAAGLRVGSSDAAFRMPGLRFGLQLGTRRLQARVGSDMARDLLCDSRQIAASEALQCGFVNRSVEPGDWDALIAQELARASALSPQAQQRMLAATVPDSRAVDMADLVASAAEPGLVQRIARYKAAG